jgi:hypothetical protein
LHSRLRPIGRARFYPDDPCGRTTIALFDASKAVPIEDTNGYDFVVNTFTHRASVAMCAR